MIMDIGVGTSMGVCLNMCVKMCGGLVPRNVYRLAYAQADCLYAGGRDIQTCVWTCVQVFLTCVLHGVDMCSGVCFDVFMDKRKTAVRVQRPRAVYLQCRICAFTRLDIFLDMCSDMCLDV